MSNQLLLLFLFLIKNSVKFCGSVLVPVPRQVLWRERAGKAFKREIPVWMDEEYL